MSREQTLPMLYPASARQTRATVFSTFFFSFKARIRSRLSNRTIFVLQAGSVKPPAPPPHRPLCHLFTRQKSIQEVDFGESHFEVVNEIVSVLTQQQSGAASASQSTLRGCSHRRLSHFPKAKMTFSRV